MVNSDKQERLCIVQYLHMLTSHNLYNCNWYQIWLRHEMKFNCAVEIPWEKYIWQVSAKDHNSVKWLSHNPYNSRNRLVEQCKYGFRCCMVVYKSISQESRAKDSVGFNNI